MTRHLLIAGAAVAAPGACARSLRRAEYEVGLTMRVSMRAIMRKR